MLRLEVVTKKIKFRVCMPMVGSQYTSKLYIKNGAMLYIKVLLWTPAECMQRGTLTRKDGGKKVMSYYSFQILLLPKDVGRQNFNVVLVAMQ